MRNTDAEKQLREAWNRKLDNYDSLLSLYKEQGYKVKRNDKTGEHIVDGAPNYSSDLFGAGNPFNEIFGGMFRGK